MSILISTIIYNKYKTETALPFYLVIPYLLYDRNGIVWEIKSIEKQLRYTKHLCEEKTRITKLVYNGVMFVEEKKYELPNKNNVKKCMYDLQGFSQKIVKSNKSKTLCLRGNIWKETTKYSLILPDEYKR